MTRKEMQAILYSINANYPHVKTTPEDAKARLELWFNTFKDYDTQTVVNAVKLHLTDTVNGKFYPTIGHITEKLKRADNYTALSAVRRAELSEGAVKRIGTPESNSTIKWLMDVYEAQGAGFYEDTDTPYTEN